MTKLTKKELIEKVTSNTDLSMKQVQAVLDAYHTVLFDEVTRGVAVAYPGFGTYSIKQTNPRRGINPKTGERIEIPAGRKLAFKVAKQIKDRLKATS